MGFLFYGNTLLTFLRALVVLVCFFSYPNPWGKPLYFYSYVDCICCLQMKSYLSKGCVSNECNHKLVLTGFWNWKFNLHSKSLIYLFSS